MNRYRRSRSMEIHDCGTIQDVVEKGEKTKKYIMIIIVLCQNIITIVFSTESFTVNIENTTVDKRL